MQKARMGREVFFVPPFMEFDLRVEAKVTKPRIGVRLCVEMSVDLQSERDKGPRDANVEVEIERTRIFRL